MRSFTTITLALSIFALASAQQICSATNGGAVANINGVCCLGIQTTASDGSDACCKGGSFTLSTPQGYPFGTASDLISIPVGTCSTIVPITQSDYSSVIGLQTASSKAGAAPALITEKPIWAGAVAGLAAGAAFL